MVPFLGWLQGPGHRRGQGVDVMTVGELLAALSSLPDDTPVYVRDWDGTWGPLYEVESYNGRVDLDAY